MNPFDWNGPEFLAFYLILSIAMIGAQVWMRRTREAEAHVPAQTPKLTDPYLVAFLAGGVNGLIRCVTVALLERKVLTLVDEKKGEVLMDPAQAGLLQSPLESAVARLFDHKKPAFEVFKELAKSPPVTLAGEQYRVSLEAAGLLPSKDQRSANSMQAMVVMGMLAAVAAVKLLLAMARGRHNVLFLIFLSVAACIVSLVLSQRRLTVPGRDALADLKQLFGGLKDKTKSGTFSNVSPVDVAFVSAVFGVAALGGSRQMYAKSLFPASSSGCGSSCGSSSGGDGGGSSCGGGGGCGGCGGG